MAETETLQPKHDEYRAKSSKHFTNFLYKASLALIFLFIIPLFPSQAPEFIHQTVPSRSWELLHLVFVGIAVSYGLFSSRNQEEEDTEKEPNPPKCDSAQSYVSRLLQASSVFDEEAEAVSSGDEVGKVETWSHQYLRKDPVVVVAKEQQPSVVDKQIGEKPLLLPVRSLKSRVSDDSMKPVDDETSGVSGNPSISRSSSKSGSKRFAGSSNVPSQLKSSEKLEGSAEKDAIVLPSPIPWRSRSGRMEVKEDLTSPLLPFSSMGDFDHFWAKPEAQSNPDSSRKKSAVSSELQAKSAEDFLRRKSFQKPSPPPPPPPPPLPHVFFKSSSMRSRTPSSSGSHLDGVSPNKDLRRSYSNEQKDVRRAPLHDVGKSVRTFRSRKDEEFGEYGAEETASMEKTRKETDNTVPKPGFFEFPEGFVEDVLSESDEDSVASENDVNEEAASVTPKNEEVRPGSSASEGGPDVDKKADEFIAKFREQIRLQRIDSIKRSSVEISRSLSR